MNYSPRYERFRELLRTIREEAGLTQVELAEKLAKPQSFVSKSELGERRLDFLETVDYCAACGVNMEDFLTRLFEVEPAPGRKRNVASGCDPK